MDYHRTFNMVERDDVTWARARANCLRLGTATKERRGPSFRLFGAPGMSFDKIHLLYPAIPWFNMETATRLASDKSEVCVASCVASGSVDGMRQLVVAEE